MEVLWWFAGLFATFYGIKIILAFMSKVYKRLTCKEGGIDNFLDGAEQKMDHAADRVVGYWKTKKGSKEKPIVEIH